MRVERTEVALELFILHFQTFFKGIRGHDKRLISKFRKWMKSNALRYITKDHANQEIPGQESFSNFEIQGEHALAVMAQEVPHISSFLQVVAAILMGTGVTVLCRSK